MNSRSANNITNDFQHEADIKQHMAHYRFRFGDNRRTGWVAKYLEITATKYDSPQMYVAIGLLLLCMYGLSKDINKINAIIAGVIYLFYSLWWRLSLQV